MTSNGTHSTDPLGPIIDELEEARLSASADVEHAKEWLKSASDKLKKIDTMLAVARPKGRSRPSTPKQARKPAGSKKQQISQETIDRVRELIAAVRTPALADVPGSFTRRQLERMSEGSLHTTTISNTLRVLRDGEEVRLAGYVKENASGKPSEVFVATREETR